MTDQRAPEPSGDPSDTKIDTPTDTPMQEDPMTRDDARTHELPTTDPDASPLPDDAPSGSGAATSSTGTVDTGAAVPVAGPTGSPRRGIRSGTVVWGLVLAAVGVGLLAWAAGLEFDVQLAVIVLIGVAGVALLSTSVASVRRRR